MTLLFPYACRLPVCDTDALKVMDSEKTLERTKTNKRKIVRTKESRASPNQNCDEAHFWLNDYINKQNCRIWSEANPQVYVETPLHPEKLTVWCALWAGGILLQKR
ncbi:hypothetical protein TNCV_5116171 [Trichonephila clavipes]|nr:hypothetical protein TNCV_5116171 [Trichonephila clavipes]